LLEKAPQLEPQTLLLHLERSFSGQEWYRRKRTLQRRVEQWKALHGPSRDVMFLQEHGPGVLGISDFTPGLIQSVSSASPAAAASPSPGAP